MELHEYIQTRANLQNQITELHNQIAQLEKDYLESGDIKVGSKVTYKGEKYYVYSWKGMSNTVRIDLVMPTKKGEMPFKKINAEYFVRLDEITLGWEE